MLAAPAMHHVHDAALANDEGTAEQRLRGVALVATSKDPWGADPATGRAAPPDAGLVFHQAYCTHRPRASPPTRELMPCTEANLFALCRSAACQRFRADLRQRLTMNFLIMGMQ